MPPISLLMKPASSMCNMRCRYCFYADVASHRAVANYGFMEADTLETLVRQALEVARDSCSFAFQGGEPTLVGLDFYRRLVDLQNQYNVHRVQIFNSIQTNGYLLDESWAAFFARHHFLVGLSVDGPAEIHDAFRMDEAGAGTHTRLMQAVALLRQFQVECNVLCVVHHTVARNGRKVYNFFKQKGLRYIQFIPCLDGFQGEEPPPYSLTARRYGEFLKTVFDQYYADFKRGSYLSVRTFDNYIMMLLGQPPEACGMRGTCSCNLVVESDGSVYPCDFYVLDQYRMGNIRQQSLEELLHTEPARRFVEESLPVDPACRNCRWLQLCRGGCRRNREPFVEGRPGRNQLCEAYRSFFEYAYPRLRELAALAAQRQKRGGM